MGKRKFGGIIIFLFISLIFAQYGFSGVTGKIAGRVVDKESGAPLPGANVMIV